LRLTSTLLRRLGQRTHLVRHYGETAAMIAGARRLNGGIEGEQICLV
jgi:hypothetical protein